MKIIKTIQNLSKDLEQISKVGPLDRNSQNRTSHPLPKKKTLHRSMALGERTPGRLSQSDLQSFQQDGLEDLPIKSPMDLGLSPPKWLVNLVVLNVFSYEVGLVSG